MDDPYTKAYEFSERLRGPPITGYKGHIPYMKDSGAGNTFHNSCIEAYKTRVDPDRVVKTAAAWCTPSSLKSAGNVLVVGGKGNRNDLQDKYTPRERDESLLTCLTARSNIMNSTFGAQSLRGTADSRMRRKPLFDQDERYQSFSPRGEKKIDPVTMVRAGEPTVSSKLDALRLGEARRYRNYCKNQGDRINAYCRS